jgi:GNAT superfamily N-acetyltransferase
MDFVKNQEEYWEFIRQLRNDKRVKAGFIQQDHISKENHLKYMEKHGNNFYVCLIDKKPAGYVGVIDRDIRVATHPSYQGKGVGKFMINALMKLYPGSLAKVKIENKASLGLFEACGFKRRYYILEKQHNE